MIPGETIRFECHKCHTEFEVCLEPKVNEMSGDEARRQGAALNANQVEFCPFCGSSTVTNLDLDEGGAP